MTGFGVFLYEWKHFLRNPFKVVAILLFILAGVFGAHNGANLYHEQVAQIELIETEAKAERQKFIDYYENGEKGPAERPWVDISSPFWAIWYNRILHYKAPSPALVYSIGQAEQYGFYKRITFRSTTLDADMTEEISNPERVQTGTLDFAFVLIYLLPLLLLILLHNLKGSEMDQGFFELIAVQAGSQSQWLLKRLIFYCALVFIVVVGLILYGATLTNVFVHEPAAIKQLFVYSFAYTALWSIAFYIILLTGNGILSNALKMAGVWLLFSFIVPGIIHQYISIKIPKNLMTEYIDGVRVDRQDIYKLADSVVQVKLNALYPQIAKSSLMQDQSKIRTVRNRSKVALVNEMMKNSIASIEDENQLKNKLTRSAYIINPISLFQNRLNKISHSHYDDYQNYRSEIQILIDQQIATLVKDLYDEVKVDKEKYTAYSEKLATLK